MIYVILSCFQKYMGKYIFNEKSIEKLTTMAHIPLTISTFFVIDQDLLL